MHLGIRLGTFMRSEGCMSNQSVIMSQVLLSFRKKESSRHSGSSKVGKFDTPNIPGDGVVGKMRLPYRPLRRRRLLSFHIGIEPGFRTRAEVGEESGKDDVDFCKVLVTGYCAVAHHKSGAANRDGAAYRIRKASRTP